MKLYQTNEGASEVRLSPFVHQHDGEVLTEFGGEHGFRLLMSRTEALDLISNLSASLRRLEEITK